MTSINSKSKQRGAAMFVALIMLLIITLLALSSVREATLESRITANNIESKRLFNAAESGLREGERRVALTMKALDSCGNIPCIKGSANTYSPDFSTAHAYTGVDGLTSMQRNTHWYLRVIDSGQTPNPTYGDVAYGIGTYYYEVNSQAYRSASDETSAATSCTIDVICLRSVIARVYTE